MVLNISAVYPRSLRLYTIREISSRQAHLPQGPRQRCYYPLAAHRAPFLPRKRLFPARLKLSCARCPAGFPVLLQARKRRLPSARRPGRYRRKTGRPLLRAAEEKSPMWAGQHAGADGYTFPALWQYIIAVPGRPTEDADYDALSVAAKQRPSR